MLLVVKSSEVSALPPKENSTLTTSAVWSQLRSFRSGSSILPRCAFTRRDKPTVCPLATRLPPFGNATGSYVWDAMSVPLIALWCSLAAQISYVSSRCIMPACLAVLCSPDNRPTLSAVWRASL